MKKILLAGACVVALTGAAFAQSSQPQGGANQSPTSPTAQTAQEKAEGMKKHNGAMDNKGAMNNGMNNNASQGTTGNAGSSQGSDKK